MASAVYFRYSTGLNMNSLTEGDGIGRLLFMMNSSNQKWLLPFMVKWIKMINKCLVILDLSSFRCHCCACVLMLWLNARFSGDVRNKTK